MSVVWKARILASLATDASSFFDQLGAEPWYLEIFEQWLNLLTVKAPLTVVEVGCGPGRLCEMLSARQVSVLGIDRSEKMIRQAKKKQLDKASFRVADATNLMNTHEVFELTLAASLINVVTERAALVSQMVRITAPEGRMSVLFPTPALKEHADEIAAKRQLTGFSQAALSIWGSRAPKLQPSVVQQLFVEAGLQKVYTNLLFHDTIAVVTGHKPS